MRPRNAADDAATEPEMAPHGRPANDAGAVMLIAVFFFVFALALVYGTIGTAQALFFREHLQDAADRTALSDAIMSARSMNLLVLINIVMSALLAVLVTLKLVEALTIIGMAIAAAIAWFFPAALAAIPPLKMIQSTMRSAYNAVKPPIDQALTVLHTVADEVRNAAPAAADAVASEEMNASPVKAGFVVSAGNELPVEDDSFKELCSRAGGVTIDLAALALRPVGGDVLKALHEPMEGLAGEFSDWFCGDSGKGPPTDTQHLQIFHPRMPWNLACESENVDVPLDRPVQDRLGPKCIESQTKDQQAMPDKATGECQPQYECSFGGPYDQRATRARAECDPSSQPAPFAFMYQQRRGHVVYTWEKGIWKRGEPTYSPPTLEKTDSLPCTSRSLFGIKRGAYNRIVHPSNDPNAIEPVCSDEVEPPSQSRPATLTQEVDFTEVKQIFGCKKNEDVVVKVSDAQAEGAGSKDRLPKRIPAHTKLGSEPFQIRSVVRGDLEALGASQIVRFALWNQAYPDDVHPILRALDGYSSAQSEYFFDGEGDQGAWMWDMSWRARLRRFRVPLDSGLVSFSGACALGLGAEDCGKLLVNLALVGDGAH